MLGLPGTATLDVRAGRRGDLDSLEPLPGDWFDLPEVQETLKCLLQHHSSKASILWCSVFFMIQLSYPYMTTGKTIALTFVGKVTSLLFNILYRFVIAFFQRASVF